MAAQSLRMRLITAALLCGVLSPFLAQGQSSEVKAMRQSVEMPAKRTAETAEDKLRLLDNAFALTGAELKDMLGETKLAMLKDRSDPALAGVANELVRQLAAYGVYVRVLRAEVKSGLTPEEIKETVAAFKEWREKLYVPAVRRGFDALLVAQGSDMLLTAQRRFEKVATDITKLQLTAGSQTVDRLINLLAVAKEEIARAQDLYARAHDRLVAEADQAATLEQSLIIRGVRTPRSVMRGNVGDFVCSPFAAVKTAHCAIAFQFKSGEIFPLFDEGGNEIVAAPGDIAQTHGVIMEFPLGASRRVSGVFLAQTVNAAPRSDETVSRAASADESVEAPATIASLIEQELGAVRRAYQSFFAMSALVSKDKHK